MTEDQRDLVLRHLDYAEMLVSWWIRRHRGWWADRDELLSIANEQLVRCAIRYDPERGETAWRELVRVRVDGAITDDLRRDAMYVAPEYAYGWGRNGNPVQRPERFLEAEEWHDRHRVTGDRTFAGSLADVASPEPEPIDTSVFTSVLSARERFVVLAYASGYSYREIGELLETSEGRAYQIAERARWKMMPEDAARGEEAQAPSEGPLLSPRELEVLVCASHGLTGEETAEQMVLSAETVKSHRKHIIRKLGARNIMHAIGIGFREGLLECAAE